MSWGLEWVFQLRLPACHCAAAQVEEHLSEHIKAVASPEPPELCTDFLLHFKALLLLWLVSVVLLQETNRVAGQLAEAMAGEEGKFHYFWSPVVFSPFLRYLCSPGSRAQSDSHCSWMLSVPRAVTSCCSPSKFHAHHFIMIQLPLARQSSTGSVCATSVIFVLFSDTVL